MGDVPREHKKCEKVRPIYGAICHLACPRENNTHTTRTTATRVAAWAERKTTDEWDARPT